jgi:hypothetical protein
MNMSLVPPAQAAVGWVRQLMTQVEELPITLEQAREQARAIATAVGTAVSTLASQTARGVAVSTLGRFFAGVLEVLAGIGSRFVTPIIIFTDEHGRPLERLVTLLRSKLVIRRQIHRAREHELLPTVQRNSSGS